MIFPEILGEVPWLETFANTVNLASIVLATRNSIHTWWTGILGCLLFGWLFFSSQLYADVTLQMFFIFTSGVGWWNWLHHRGCRESRPITRSAPCELVLSVPIGALAALAYGWLLHRFTDAYSPFVDSAVLALSVAGQVLLMRRKLETWIFWFLANTFAVVLFSYRELWITAFFYVLFWFNAPVGLFRWLREMRNAPNPT